MCVFGDEVVCDFMVVEVWVRKEIVVCFDKYLEVNEECKLIKE